MSPDASPSHNGRLPTPSGLHAHLGIETLEWADGQATLALALVPAVSNLSGGMHGGALATMADIAGAYACSFASVRGGGPWCATLALSLSFMGRVGEGRVMALGRRVKTAGRTAFAEIAMMQQGELVASASGVFRFPPRAG